MGTGADMIRCCATCASWRVREHLHCQHSGPTERDEAFAAIRDFAEKQNWAVDIWKQQAHIKRLFDIANETLHAPTGARSAEGR